jgi:hypothetical protein
VYFLFHITKDITIIQFKRKHALRLEAMSPVNNILQQIKHA